MHYLDIPAIHRDPSGLGRLVAEGHSVVVDGENLRPEVVAVRFHPGAAQVPFATLEEAAKSFDAPLGGSYGGPLFVGDSVLDTVLDYRTGDAVYDYQFSSRLDPGLDGQEDTANLLLDHFANDTQVYRASGLLREPIVVSRSALAAALTFVKEGVRHILEGLDHVLFVVCLALGAARFSDLLWRVTGFTVGHSVTLAAGFFGFVPSGAWFVPAVETGIALSIVYAAVIALMQRQHGATVLITAAIGLLHGLGFSFVLSEILQLDSANIWQSLLAFNVGVELGQIAIVLVCWPLFHYVSIRRQALWPALRGTVALPCIALAALWAGQRLVMVAQAV